MVTGIVLINRTHARQHRAVDTRDASERFRARVSEVVLTLDENEENVATARDKAMYGVAVLGGSVPKDDLLHWNR